MAEELQVKEKRVCPDFWCNSVKWLSFLGWILLFIAMILFHEGRPQITTGFKPNSIEKVRDAWDPEFAPYFLSIMITVAYISLMGFYVNLKRQKRKEDKYNISIIFLLLLSLMGLSYYFFN